MKRAAIGLVVVLAGVLAAVLVFVSVRDDQPDRKALPQPLPAQSLAAFESDSEPLELADLRGPAVLSFWASWCAPCRAELPVLEAFHQQHADRVDMIGIDFQDPQTAKAARLIEQTGVTYPLYADFQGDLNALAPFPALRGLPFIALVDERGEVVHQEFGVIESVAELETLVQTHLGVGA